jgi:hypothetical protein
VIFYEDTTIKDILKTFEDYYVKRDYTKALETLQIHAHDLPLGVLHYNMGTVHAKMENWSSARYHFLMATESGLSLPELKQSREVVESKLEIGKLEKPINTSDYLIQASLVANGGILSSVSLMFLLMGLVFLRKSASLIKVLIWTFVVIIPVGLNFWINSWSRSISIGPLIISEGPSKIFNSSGELPPGILVLTTGEGEWRKIAYPSRFKGWVKVSGLKQLE